MKLSLSMIVKGGLEDLKRLKPLVEPYIDEWVVVFPPEDEAIEWAKENGITAIVKDFTQGIEPEIIEQFKQYGLEVDSDYRIFNFAAARNASLEACTGDYVLWLDADDTPLGIDNIKKFIEKNDADVYNAVYDYFRDEEGNSISDHMRERVFKNDGRFHWLGGKLGLIHETLLPKEGEDAMEIDFPDEVFRVQHDTDHVEGSSMRNHIALLYEYLKTDGEDPRTTYYLGTEFFNRGMYEYCIKVLQEYVKASGWTEEKYHAYLKMAEAYHMLEDRKSGRNMYLVALDELPNYPHAYLGLGESYWQEEEWAKAVEYTLTGLQKKPPTGKYVVDPTRFTFRPYVYMALSLLQLGKLDEAVNWFVKAAKLNPKHPWIEEYADIFKETKEVNDYVKAFVKLGQLAQKKYPKTLSKIAEIIPDELKDQELLLDFRWRYAKPKIWSDKSIVFFCSSAFEDWGPESLLKGCGGSEESVIQLSKRLAKLGWEVTVFNNCIREAKIDGVDWVRFERFNPRDIFNIVVSWRNNLFVDKIVANKRYADLHDVPEEKFYVEQAVKDVTLLVKSEYHRSLLPNVTDGHFVIIPNGVDDTELNGDKKIKNNIVWTSSYDRGLEYLLMMWPDIKKEVPDATLDCYYGFNLFDATPWGRRPSGQAWKAKMLQLLDQDGVSEHGRVSTSEVAKAYNKADVWAYPTAFPEISCMTAMKAQQAGAVPVSTDYAALKETVKHGVVIEGRGDTKEVQDKFKSELIALLKDDERKDKIRKELKDVDFSWDRVADQWNEEFSK